MRSHLYLAADVPRDPETGAEDTAHFQMRTVADGRLAIHAHPSAQAPQEAEVIRDGRLGEWDWDGLAATHPGLASELLLVEVADVLDGGTTRIPQADAIAQGLPILAGPFAPHYWTDDQPSSE